MLIVFHSLVLLHLFNQTTVTNQVYAEVSAPGSLDFCVKLHDIKAAGTRDMGAATPHSKVVLQSGGTLLQKNNL